MIHEKLSIPVMLDPIMKSNIIFKLGKCANKLYRSNNKQNKSKP